MSGMERREKRRNMKKSKTGERDKRTGKKRRPLIFVLYIVEAFITGI